MGELGNFLYGQKVVRPILKQFFRCPFFTVKELHDVQVGAVHAGAVLQLIYGIAPAVDAKASCPRHLWGREKAFLSVPVPAGFLPLFLFQFPA